MPFYYCISVSEYFWMIFMVYVCVCVCVRFADVCASVCVYVCLAHSIVTWSIKITRPATYANAQ